MDKGRIRRAAEAASLKGMFGKGGPPDPNAALRRRLLAYLVLVVLMGAWIFRGGSEPDAPGSSPAVRPLDDDLVPAPIATPLVQVDHALLDTVRDGTPAERARLERDVRLHLLDLSSRLIYGDLERLGLHKADRKALMADPAAHRGEALWVIGRLKWWDSATLDGLYEVRGELEDEQGGSWAFLVATEPRDLSRAGPLASVPSDIEIGEVVRLKGFFFKDVDLARPDRTLFTAPMLVGRELLRSAFRIEPVTSIDDGMRERLARVQDQTLGLAELPLESPVFYELLSFAKHGAPDDFAPPDQITETTPTPLLTRPDDWRGRPVQIVGTLLVAEQPPLGPNGENPLGEPLVWTLWLSDARAGEMGTMELFTFDIPAGLKPGMIVEAKGRFFRRYAYESGSHKPHIASVIVANQVWTYVPPADTFTPMLVKSLVGGAALVLIVIVLGNLRDRRASSKERARRMDRTRKLVALPGALARGREAASAAADDATDGVSSERSSGEAGADAPPAPHGDAASEPLDEGAPQGTDPPPGGGAA